MCNVNELNRQFQDYENLYDDAMKVIATSPYPDAHGLARVKLDTSKTYFTGAVNAFSNSMVEEARALLTLALASLTAAHKAIVEKAATDQRMVDEYYRDKDGQPKGSGAYI